MCFGPAHRMGDGPAPGLRVRLAMAVAASFTLLLAVSAIVLYGVLRREWWAEVDRGLRQSAEAARSLFDSDLPDYGSPEATTVHIISELVFGDRTLVARDSTGRLIARSRPIGGLPVLPTSFDGTGPAPTTLEAAAGRFRAVSVSLPNGLSLVIAFPLTSLEDRLASLRLILGLGLVLSVVAGTGVAVMASRRALEPITTMATLADQVSEAIGRGNVPLPAIPGARERDEVGRLQQAFRALVDTLETARATERRAAADQRRFFADAAHELRTPVAILQNEIGVALNGPAVNINRTILARLATETQQLSQLVADLLLLARGESTADVAAHTVYLDDVASKAVHRAGQHPAAANRRIAVGQFDAARVRGDAALLERAILALIENALLHAAPSDIEVGVGVDEHRGAWVSVTDHGEAIPEDATSRIFERFVRLQRETPGSGLGLAIVRRIAELHGGTLGLTQSADPRTKVFTVRLPVV